LAVEVEVEHLATIAAGVAVEVALEVLVAVRI
jgi:predicted thioesterase